MSSDVCTWPRSTPQRGGREGKRGRGDCATSRRVVVVAMVEGGDGGVVAWRVTCALA